MAKPEVLPGPWYKSSYSSANGQCVECASAVWSTSSYSGREVNCLQIAPLPAAVAVRDSKHPERSHLSFAAPEWAVFLRAVRRGEL